MEGEGVTFSSKVKPVGSTKQLSLGGAGVRGLEIDGMFIKFTAIGIYLEESVLLHLALKWKNKTEEELGNAGDFFMGIVTCPYEKFTRVTLILPLSGTQYSEKVSEGCKAAWEAAGIYGEAEAHALEQFKVAFNDHNFTPGSSIQFTHLPAGLVIAFSKDSSIPEKVAAVIQNRVLAQGILVSIIGKNSVSPAAKASLAERVSRLVCKEINVPTVTNECNLTVFSRDGPFGYLCFLEWRWRASHFQPQFDPRAPRRSSYLEELLKLIICYKS